MARGYPDFEGDKSGLYLKPEWAAKEGKDKDFLTQGLNKAFGESKDISYAVPALKILLVTQLFASNMAVVAADADNNQFCIVEISVGDMPKYEVGMNGGGLVVLAKPYVIDSEETVAVNVTNRANHNTNINVGFSGYEVDA